MLIFKTIYYVSFLTTCKYFLQGFYLNIFICYLATIIQSDSFWTISHQIIEKLHILFEHMCNQSSLHASFLNCSVVKLTDHCYIDNTNKYLVSV